MDDPEHHQGLAAFAGGETAEQHLDAAAALLNAIRDDLAQCQADTGDETRSPESLRVGIVKNLEPLPSFRFLILRQLPGWSLARGAMLVLLGVTTAALGMSVPDRHELQDHKSTLHAETRQPPLSAESIAVRTSDGPNAEKVAKLKAAPQAASPTAQQVSLVKGDADAFPNPASGRNHAGQSARVSATERDCLRRAVYYEARGEPVAGQIAIAQVVLNRVKSGRWRSSICGVLYQGVGRGSKCQFSFACSRSRLAAPRGKAWEQAIWVADEVLDKGAWLREMAEATHFHRHDRAPVWRLALTKIGRVGAHVFYAAAGASPGMSFVLAEAHAPSVSEQVPLADPPATPGKIRRSGARMLSAQPRLPGALHRLPRFRGAVLLSESVRDDLRRHMLANGHHPKAHSNLKRRAAQ